MRRPSRKLLCEFAKVDPVPLFEPKLSELVLLDVMELAETDRPAIGRLECCSAVGVAPDVGALNRAPEAAFDAAMVAPDPRAMRRAFALVGGSDRLAFKPFR